MPAGVTETVVAWGSKGLLNEKINPRITTNDNISPKLKWHNSKIRVEFKGSCLKQDKVNSTPRNLVNLFSVYELDT